MTSWCVWVTCSLLCALFFTLLVLDLIILCIQSCVYRTLVSDIPCTKCTTVSYYDIFSVLLQYIFPADPLDAFVMYYTYLNLWRALEIVVLFVLSRCTWKTFSVTCTIGVNGKWWQNQWYCDPLLQGTDCPGQVGYVTLAHCWCI